MPSPEDRRRNPAQNNLIPDDVLNSVFDGVEQRPEQDPDADTMDFSPPLPDGSGWPTFDWQEGQRSWDESLTSFRFPKPKPVPNVIAPTPHTEDVKNGISPSDEVQPEHIPVAKPGSDSAASSAKVSTQAKEPMSLAESILAVMIYVAGVLVASFLLATLGWRWANDVLALDKSPKTVSVTIRTDETIDEVAQDLQSKGLIEYPMLFKTFAAVTGKVDEITTGTYELSTEMDYSALLRSFRKTSAARETADVTIPEGYTLEEIFQLLEKAGVCSAADLMKSAEEDTFYYPFFEGMTRTGAARLEGYLFPDTYQFYKGTQAHSVISRLLDNFYNRFDSVMTAEQQLSGYSVDEIVIMASIIEKETTGEDRNTISGVIYNRLKDPDHDDIQGRLQMDSTVQYLLSERKAHLTNEDIAIESPYNTYLVTGLPVGPICNPGLESLRAALSPEKHNYYYFMLGTDGEDHFFKDKEKFEAFKARTAEASEQDEQSDNKDPDEDEPSDDGADEEQKDKEST